MKNAPFFLLLIISAGCSGGPENVAAVTGTVTLDGAPLPNAYVLFTPVGGGVPSGARTDDGGNYELVYSRDANGAEIGEHLVSVTTYSPGDPTTEPPVLSIKEKVPIKYNSQSELKVKVKKGENNIPLPIKTDGPIQQPTADGAL